MIKYLDELERDDLKGKRVLLRLDLNVPVVNGQVADDFDIQKIIATVDFLREKEAQTIIIAHIEDQDGKPTTLLPVLNYLSGYFKVDFSPSYFTPEAVDKILNLKDKEVLLFENVRFNEGETKDDPGQSLLLGPSLYDLALALAVRETLPHLLAVHEALLVHVSHCQNLCSETLYLSHEV